MGKSRRVFDLVLRDRIRFRPVERKDGPGYELRCRSPSIGWSSA